MSFLTLCLVITPFGLLLVSLPNTYYDSYKNGDDITPVSTLKRVLSIMYCEAYSASLNLRILVLSFFLKPYFLT